MAFISFTDFKTGTDVEIGPITGTGSIQSTIKLAGSDYAFRCNPTGSDVGYIQANTFAANGAFQAGSSAAMYTGFWIYIVTLPASGSEEIVYLTTTGNARKFSVRINSAGKLEAYDASNTIIGSAGTTTLSAGNFYYISTKSLNGTTAAYEVKIGNSTELSGTANLNTTNYSTIARFGKANNNNNQTVDYVYNVCVVSDSDFPLSTYRTATFAPNSNGSTMQFTAGTGSSDFNEVKELVPDSANYVQSTGAGNEQALFGFESCSQAGIGASDTIQAIKVLTRNRENVTGNSATGVRIRSGSTNSDSSTRNNTTTPQLQGRLLSLDPNGNVAWTQSAVDAVEGGIYDTSAVVVRCEWVRMFVLYDAISDTTGPTIIQALGGG